MLQTYQHANVPVNMEQRANNEINRALNGLLKQCANREIQRRSGLVMQIDFCYCAMFTNNQSAVGGRCEKVIV